MNNQMVRVTVENYARYTDMVYWRMTGKQREKTDDIPDDIPDEAIRQELADRNLYVYAVEVEERFVGWISLIYLPKVGKFNGHGHIYVDELWVEPSYRNQGLAKALMAKAEAVAKEREATGIRLYVNTENPVAEHLYEKCGYTKSCSAYLMEQSVNEIIG